MTLPERITLINSLIKEDRDHTIRDYLDTVAEIEQIKPIKIERLCRAS